MEGRKIAFIYLISINILTFFVFGWDKNQARREGWRISEKNLFILVLLGGGAGALAGMKIWHHKTRKWYFRFGIPVLMMIQGGLLLYVISP